MYDTERKSFMIHRLIIVHLYTPGSAATNRILAYSKAFAELGIEVVLVLGCDKVATLPSISGVRVIGVKSTVHYLIMPRIAKTVKQYYSNSTAILVYGTPLLCLFLPKLKYNIFYECTEVPFYGMKETWVMRIKESFKLSLARKATGMFVISKALQDYFSSRGICNIAVINMFVDASRFQGIQGTNTEKYIAYCGKISNFKDGLDCLIKAFKIFHDRYPNYTLKLIGDFRFPDFEPILKSLINSLELKDCVEFTGAIDSEIMPTLLGDACFLVLARPNNEQARYGFPTKLGEYLATGKPVVVTRVGEIDMFLKDGVNCKMAVPDNPEDFADKMIWIANHYEEALQLGGKGKELTLTEFSSVVQSEKALKFMNRFVK